MSLAVGIVSELRRFGASDQAAAARIAARVQGDFSDTTRVLSDVAAGVAATDAAARGLALGEDGQRGLFDLLRDVRLDRAGSRDVAITIYDASRDARAWAGRPSDLPEDRIRDEAALFVTRSPLGLRLVYVRPILDAASRHVGAVAVENTLAPTPASTALTPPEFILPNPIAPVSIRMRFDSGADAPTPGAFLLRSPAGVAVAEGSVALDAIGEARRAWRAMVAGQLLACLAITCCLLIGPLLDRRAAAREPRTFVVSTLTASALLVAGAVVLRASFAVAGGTAPDLSGRVVLAGLTAAALAALWAAAVVRRRLRFRGARRDPAAAPAPWLASQLAAGIVVALILIVAERVISAIVDASTIDLRHFSLHPWNATRPALLGGLLAVQLTAVWASTLVLSAAPAALAHALATLEHARNPARGVDAADDRCRAAADCRRHAAAPGRGADRLRRLRSGRGRRAAESRSGSATRPRSAASSRCSSPFSSPRSSSIRRSISSPSAPRGA